MAVIRHEPLDHPLETQQELHLLGWPYLAALFAVLTQVVFFVVAN